MGRRKQHEKQGENTCFHRSRKRRFILYKRHLAYVRRRRIIAVCLQPIHPHLRILGFSR